MITSRLYSVKLYWNDALVMDGRGTAVASYDTAYNHIAANFAGPEHSEYLKSIGETLSALLSNGLLDWGFGSARHGGKARAIVSSI